MKFLKYGLLALLILFVIAITIGYFSGKNDFYYLSLINSGPDSAQIKVSLSDRVILLKPGESKTVQIENQDDKDVHMPRTFTITSKGVTDTLTGPVAYSGFVVLDVTGTSCIVAADYGPQYRGQLPLPAEQSDIKIVKTFSGQKLFLPSIWDEKTQTHDVHVDLALGDPLPEKVKITSGQIPVYIRLVGVPCELSDNPEALYNYLNDH